MQRAGRLWRLYTRIWCYAAVLQPGTIRGVSGILEIASQLVYAYQHNPLIQVRKMANSEHVALLKQGVAA